MGLLTFSINVTLDGCVDHQEGIADNETHAFFTRLMGESGAILWGRVMARLFPDRTGRAVDHAEMVAPGTVRAGV